MRRIDAHHHLWRFNEEEYAWLEGDLLSLQRDFLPETFTPEMEAAGVTRTIVVQARQTVNETDWLLEVATASPSIGGVVGWLPMRDPAFPALLDQYRTKNKLVGLRHVVQAEPAGFMDEATFRRGVAALSGIGLTYDILIHAHQLQEATRLVSCFPEQVFVLDHLAKPLIRKGEIQPWAADLRALAHFPNVSCKVSGMVTEADPRNWEPEQLRPYFEVALEAFTPSRLMAGSDWPVLLAGCTYQAWWSLLAEWTGKLSAEEQAEFFARTAERTYGLKTSPKQSTVEAGAKA